MSFARFARNNDDKIKIITTRTCNICRPPIEHLTFNPIARKFIFYCMFRQFEIVTKDLMKILTIRRFFFFFDAKIINIKINTC